MASRSHLSPETEDYIEKMKRCHSDVELISSGSSIKICLVAEVRRMYIPVLLPPWNGIRQQGMPLHGPPYVMEVYQAGKEAPLQYNKEDLLNPWFIVEPRRN